MITPAHAAFAWKSRHFQASMQYWPARYRAVFAPPDPVPGQEGAILCRDVKDQWPGSRPRRLPCFREPFTIIHGGRGNAMSVVAGKSAADLALNPGEFAMRVFGIVRNPINS